MTIFSRTARSVSLVTLALSFGLGTPSAHAQGLFDVLFGGGIKKKQVRSEFPPAPPKVRKQVVAAPRISAPTYYTYKADPLVRVNFTALMSAEVATTAAIQTASAEPGAVAFEPPSGDGSFREALAGLGGFDLMAEKDIAAALTDYYSAHPAFIWVDGDAANSRAQDAVRVLSSADTFGLSVADYAVTVPSASDLAGDAASRRDALIRFEMTLSARVLRYVKDATSGRVDPNKISGYHDLPVRPAELNGAIRTLANSADVKTFLESHHPQSAEYRALRIELESLRASEENAIVVDPKLLLKPGEASAEFPKLMQIIARGLDDEMGGEFGETIWRLGKSELYDPALVPAIEAVQKQAGLKADGVIGPRTVAALAGTSKAERLEKVVIALEQMRWLPSDLGSTRVFVNQPAYTASYIEDGAEKLNMRVVVGEPATQTTFFYDKIEQVDYNPYWGVPQSIIVNEMLPRLRRDPGYLDRAGYEVTDAKGRRISSSSVAWGSYGSKIPYNVRQTPSEDNALGELKILFPNKHAIYMHDTPSKSYFQRDMRALSHGCVRLQDPRGMAAAVLGTSLDYVASKLKQGHSSEKIMRDIPVYMAYFTAWPGVGGNVEYFADVYDRDSHVRTALQRIEEARAPSA